MQVGEKEANLGYVPTVLIAQYKLLKFHCELNPLHAGISNKAFLSTNPPIWTT
jgi:hypothetical protein